MKKEINWGSINVEEMTVIERLQTNLSIIRNLAGWSMSEFGEKIGITKQSVYNLESGISTMTKTQYLAIRTVLDYEILQHKDDIIEDGDEPNKILLVSKALSALVDNPDKKEYKTMKDKFSVVATLMNAGVAFGVILTAIGGGILAGPIGAGAAVLAESLWIRKLMKETDEKDK